MTIRVHIDRLVIDPKALPPAQVPAFLAALGEALGRLQAGSLAAKPAGGVAGLAERTASDILQRVSRR